MSRRCTIYYCVCVTLLAYICGVNSQRYIVPDATLEFLNPRGLRISIPDDDPDIKLVAYHINVNEEFQGLQHGHFGADITKKRDGRWSYNIPDFRVKQGDTIYYWIHVIVDKLAYNGLDREYKVTDPDPHRRGTPVTSRPPPGPTDCPPSQTTHNDRSVCPNTVILNKQFTDLDGWKHRVTIGGSDLEDGFVVFMKDSDNSRIDNGKLVIKPTLLEDRSNDSFVRNGELVLQGCTSTVGEECVKRARLYHILPPVVSARLHTKDAFSFRYGTVELKAKLPRGNWIVPELWLVPVDGPSADKVVMGLARGNTDDSEYGWKTLEAGVISETQQSLGKRSQDRPWSQDFHTFKLVWTPEQITFFVDNQEVHRVPSSNYSMLRRSVFIAVGIHVAGSRDFPDNINNKPWKNSNPKRFATFWDDKTNWYSTWNEDSTLQIEYIKVTAL